MLKMRVPPKAFGSSFIIVTASKHPIFFNEKNCFLMIFEREPEKNDKNIRLQKKDVQAPEAPEKVQSVAENNQFEL
jgi:hypothetical protein